MAIEAGGSGHILALISWYLPSLMASLMASMMASLMAFTIIFQYNNTYHHIDNMMVFSIPSIRRPPLGVFGVKPAVLLSCCDVLLYCCTAFCCISTTVIVNKGQGLRAPTSGPTSFHPLISTHFEETHWNSTNLHRNRQHSISWMPTWMTTWMTTG